MQKSITLSELNASTAPNEMQNEHDQRDDEKEMDQSAGNMEGESAAPKEQEKNGNNE